MDKLMLKFGLFIDRYVIFSIARQKSFRSFSFICSQHFVSLCGNSKPHENGL